ALFACSAGRRRCDEVVTNVGAKPRRFPGDFLQMNNFKFGCFQPRPLVEVRLHLIQEMFPARRYVPAKLASRNSQSVLRTHSLLFSRTKGAALNGRIEKFGQDLQSWRT